MRVIGYLRVSTAEQATGGHSLDAQRAAITAEAERRGWDVRWVEDAASAKDLNRMGLAYALHLLAAGEAEGVVVARLDRLSRSVLDFATLLQRAQDEGWNVNVLDLGLDLSTPYGRFGATVLMSAAQLERDLISARTREGLAAARAKGVRPGPRSSLPTETVDLVATLRGDGLNLTQIAARLTHDAVPLPSGVTGAWQPAQVRRVLARATSPVVTSVR